ncbi:hypothetical protein BC835DRAFT_739843 [Cytidiella melzeri]|nr:hypothetical protein BC835DRAFT_739843 [Cytidiella melzeri]
MHTTLCCRVILHLRIAAATPDLDNDTGIPVSRPIRFASHPRRRHRHTFVCTGGSELVEMQSTMCGTFSADIQALDGVPSCQRGDGDGERSLFGVDVV